MNLIKPENMHCTELEIKGISMTKGNKVAVKEIPLNQIRLGRNSRMNISNEEIAGLMESIKETGLLQPIGVVPGKKGGYEVCYGNRRFLAISKLGMKSIPAIVHESTKDSDVDLKNLTENIQRRNLSLAESGRYVLLLKEQGLTNAEIAVRLGVSGGYVASCISAYQNVPAEFRDDLMMQIGGAKLPPGKIGMTVASEIIGAANTFRLNSKQTRTLFQQAKTNEDFSRANIKKYASALKSGVTDPLKKVKNVHRVNITAFVTEDEYNRLYRKHVDNGPYNTVVAALRAIISGHLNERVKFVENK